MTPRQFDDPTEFELRLKDSGIGHVEDLIGFARRKHFDLDQLLGWLIERRERAEQLVKAGVAGDLASLAEVFTVAYTLGWNERDQGTDTFAVDSRILAYFGALYHRSAELSNALVGQTRGVVPDELAQLLEDWRATLPMPPDVEAALDGPRGRAFLDGNRDLIDQIRSPAPGRGPTEEEVAAMVERSRDLCHRHGAYNPEGDCFVCDAEQAREATQAVMGLLIAALAAANGKPSASPQFYEILALLRRGWEELFEVRPELVGEAIAAADEIEVDPRLAWIPDAS